jgi:molecular chaperone HscB
MGTMMSAIIGERCFFELFSIPISWHIDRELIETRYKQLQKQFHPDRFVTNIDVEKRLAAQTAAFINDAYATLISPLQRAQYLLKLQGIEIDHENQTTSDIEFLTQQIALREELADIEQLEAPFEALNHLEKRLDKRYEELQVDFKESFTAGNYGEAMNSVVKMQFFVKLLLQVELLDDKLIG